MLFQISKFFSKSAVERETSKPPMGTYKVPSKVDSLETRAQKHSQGTFPNISVKGPERTQTEVVQELTSSLRVKSDEFPEISHPIRSLVGIKEIVTLKSLLGNRWKILFSKKKFINLKSLLVVLRPTTGFMDPASDITVYIEDLRQFHSRNDQRTMPTNAASSQFFALDYAVHYKDLAKVRLVLDKPKGWISQGTVWASLSLISQFKHGEEAVGGDFIPATGLAEVPSTGLVSFKNHPRKLNLTISENTRRELIKKRKNGQLKDLSKAQGDQDIEGFGGSEAGDSFVDENLSEEDFEDYEAPIRNVIFKERSSNSMPKSIMKTSSGKSENDKKKEMIIRWSGLTDLTEVSPENLDIGEKERESDIHEESSDELLLKGDQEDQRDLKSPDLQEGGSRTGLGIFLDKNFGNFFGQTGNETRLSQIPSFFDQMSDCPDEISKSEVFYDKRNGRLTSQFKEGFNRSSFSTFATICSETDFL
jgi:hypothetical protein